MAEGSSLLSRWRRWIIVPALAWGGILLGLVLPFQPPFTSFGGLGCLLGSLAIAVIAWGREKRDIVSLFTPLFAVIIFLLPAETPDPAARFLVEVLYAVTLTALVIRLEKVFPW